VFLLLSLFGVAGALAVGDDPIPEKALSAGIFAVARVDSGAFSESPPSLTYAQRERFLRGRHHFGRARNAKEAIPWHSGEAEASREFFRRLPKPDRDALLFFLDSI
jgi:CxxC motif-containing protein (DUF1111 family)